MAQHLENKTIDGAVELLKTNGFDALAEAVTVKTILTDNSREFCGKSEAHPYELLLALHEVEQIQADLDEFLAEAAHSESQESRGVG